MKYLYFPGCCAKGTGKPYEESILSVFKALEVPLEELKDWNCCGATAYMSVDELKSFTLCSRNLSLALAQGGGTEKEPVHLVAPCSACYALLLKTQQYIEKNPEVERIIKTALKQVGLESADLNTRVRIRHPLDVLVNDIGFTRIHGRVKKLLPGMKVACYYGCQLVRPNALFDSTYHPTSMDRLAKALGAEPIDWPLKTRCCGATLAATIQGVGLRLSFLILREARKRGANLVLTACPVCQFDLECFQDQMNTRFKYGIQMPVAYFTQLVGMTFGIPDRQIGLHRLFMQPKMAAAAQGG